MSSGFRLVEQIQRVTIPVQRKPRLRSRVGIVLIRENNQKPAGREGGIGKNVLVWLPRIVAQPQALLVHMAVARVPNLDHDREPACVFRDHPLPVPR